MKLLIKNIIALVFIGAMLLACNNEPKKSKTVEFKGKITSEYIDEVSLYDIQDGEAVLLSSTQLINGNEYSLIQTIETKGFYGLQAGGQTRLIYLEGGEEFEIDFSSSESILVHIPNKENEVLAMYEDKFSELNPFTARNSSETYETFFPFLDSYIPEYKALELDRATGNKEFDDLLAHYADYKLEKELLYFIYSPRKVHPKVEDYPNIYQTFGDHDNYKNARVLGFPNFSSAINLHQIYRSVALEKADRSMDRDQWLIGDIPNDTIKGVVVLEKMKRFKSYDQAYSDFMDPLRKYVHLTESGSATLVEFEQKISKLSPGTQGFGFDLEAFNGGQISFSELEGKYVYVDLWATWCGPCKYEIPHLKRLDEQYDESEIVFVSISLDKPRDKEKWREFVEKNELKGLQLFGEAAFESPIATHYEVKSIPRFLLFDKEGKIISADALRPSNPDLKIQIDNLLKS